VKPIDEEKYDSRADNGYEIVNKSPKNQPLKAEPKLIEPANDKGFPQPLIETGLPTKKREEPKGDQTKDDILESVHISLSETSLPSKSPLSHSDPFHYLTSPKFLTTFIAATTVIVFLITLFD
jgi:hypothetical protein